MAMKPVVYTVPGMDRIAAHRDLVYGEADGRTLTFDVYVPDDSKSVAPRPAVVFAIGFSDAGAEKILGCPFKEMASYVSWAQLTAASGLMAITYSTSGDPATDLQHLLAHLDERASALGIDRTRVGIWACSGHVPTALSVLMANRRERCRCAVLCYGFMLDTADSHDVADAARAMKFANPCERNTIDDLTEDTALFIARAGRDATPHLNDALDRFVADAIRRNLPITVVNHAYGPHTFDLIDDSDRSREIVAAILSFMQHHLRAA
jgi:hypothetical protein